MESEPNPEADLQETGAQNPVPNPDHPERPHFIAWGRTLVFAAIAYGLAYWLSGPVWALAAGYGGAALLLYGHYPNALKSSARKAVVVAGGIIIVGGFTLARNMLTPSAPKQADPASVPAKATPVTAKADAPTAAPKVRETKTPDSEGPIDGLLKLGWNVVASANNPTVVNFQNSRMPLPDMVKSAQFMKGLKGKLNVGIIEASSLAGLSRLSVVDNIYSLQLAGNFPDLTELRSFKKLLRLNLVGGSSLHLEPVGSLTQLRELVLQQPHDRSPDLSALGALANLERLSIYGLALPEIPAIRKLKSLKYLDLTDTPVTDLSMLRELEDLSELIIDQRSIPALRSLLGSSLATLEIKHAYGMKEPIDLNPLTALQKLRTVRLMASTSLTLAPLTSLPELSDLRIWGTSVSIETMRDNTIHLMDAASIGELHQLKRLELAWVDVSDTRFMVGLGSLEEVYLDQLHSLTDIRGIDTLNKLRFVQLVATNVVDIRPLLNVRSLKTLVVQVTPARNDVITELKERGVLVKE